MVKEEIEKVRQELKGKASKLSTYFNGGKTTFAITQEWKTLTTGVDIKEVEVSDRFTAVIISGKKGAVKEPHYHTEFETVFVLSGKIRELITGSVHGMSQSFSIEPGYPHGMEFLEDSLLVIQWIPKLPKE